jgi:multidrug efflux pump subunit AcrB
MEEKQNKNIVEVIREFGLSTWAVTNRTTVFFITFIIFILGAGAYVNMPKEAFPEVVLPQIVVSSPYPGNSAENIEKFLTKPMEKEFKSLDGVKKIISNSLQDYSVTIVEFQPDVSVDQALQDVKDAVDKAKSKKDWPTDLDQDPSVSDMNMADFPIMFINLFGDYPAEQLKDYAENFKDEIEALAEINEVNIRGIEEKEVKIDLDVHKLTSMKLSFSDVENAIKGRNISMSAGNLQADGMEISIKIDDQFKDVTELNNIIVKSENAEEVYLRDLLGSKPIRLEPKERRSYAKFNGENVVMLDVKKQSGQNLIEASNKINEIIKSFRQEGRVPKDLEIVVTLDQSDDTRESVANLENSIISGIILVVGVLLFFLGTRNALFVGIAIPMSMFLSFVILDAFGITINMMVLFGLIMALGMLVDNGIVVVENVYRLMDLGYSPIKAAKEGVGEIAWPIIASTATTLAAFLPLILWPGIMGEFMKFLPITLMVVLGSSLFVALVINPVFTAVFMKIKENKINRKKMWIVCGIITAVAIIGVFASYGMEANIIKNIRKLDVRERRLEFAQFIRTISNLSLLIVVVYILNIYLLNPIANFFQGRLLPALEDAYEKFLTSALKGARPWVYLGGTFGLLIFSNVLMNVFPPEVLFFPENEPKYFNVFIEMPLGTDIEKTNAVAERVEKEIEEVIYSNERVKNIVKAFTLQVGEGTSDPGDPFAGAGSSTPHKARLTVEFKGYQVRKENDTSSTDIMNAVRNKIKKENYLDAIITVEKNRDGPPVGKPINIEVSGLEIDSLRSISERIIHEINKSGIEGVEGLKTDLEVDKPEYIIEINNSEAERLGVSTFNIADNLRKALYGSDVSRFKDGDDDYDIYLRLSESYRHNINALMNQSVTFRDPSNGQIKQVPISSIASVKDSSSLGSIRRKNKNRVITVYSNVIDGYNATKVNDKLRKHLAKNMDMPRGYSFNFTGEQQEQAENMEFLTGALMMALFLILLIIVAQFNRFSAPVIILVSVLLSTTGVFLGLIAFNMEFVILMTMIGIISLAGIVVNNAIVLIDYTILLKNRTVANMSNPELYGRQELEANLIEGGKTRLRPVLLTAITTVLGLIPLAIGLNIDFFDLVKNYDAHLSIGSDQTIFWGPMSWTIIFGITFATFLTLVVVPVMFLLVERLKAKVYKRP